MKAGQQAKPSDSHTVLIVQDSVSKGTSEIKKEVTKNGKSNT